MFNFCTYVRLFHRCFPFHGTTTREKKKKKRGKRKERKGKCRHSRARITEMRIETRFVAESGLFPRESSSGKNFNYMRANPTIPRVVRKCRGKPVVFRRIRDEGRPISSTYALVSLCACLERTINRRARARARAPTSIREIINPPIMPNSRISKHASIMPRDLLHSALWQLASRNLRIGRRTNV